MNQKKIPFSRSLNPIPSIIHHNDLIDKWKKYKKQCRQMNLPQPTFEDWMENMDIDHEQEIRKPLDRLAYYRRFASYKNNLKA